jgi:hypothetical protein
MCKYVEIFTHRHVGSIVAPSRRTMLEGHAQNSENPRRLLAGTRRPTFSKREVQDLRPR